MDITITIKSVYGRPCYYPASDSAKIIAKMLNQKCLTKPQLEALAAAGATVSVYNDDVNVADIPEGARS